MSHDQSHDLDPCWERAVALHERYEDQQLAQQLMQEILPYTGASIRIGISGLPGVGKSSLLDTLGMILINKGLRIAILAIDPSSNMGGGSILGDKTRMHRLAIQPKAYIRPSASGKNFTRGESTTSIVDMAPSEINWSSTVSKVRSSACELKQP